VNSVLFDVDSLMSMAHSPVSNYVIPGLTSYLIGGRSERGTVRLFHCSREHQEAITPHSHRFDFQCWVLRGNVRNRLWRRAAADHPAADQFCVSSLSYKGAMGDYSKEPLGVSRWVHADHCYSTGECYSMKADEVHSIFFSRGAVVLFFEGPSVSDHSIALEPYVDNETIPTMETRPWMFRRKEAA
jgi:hypothetical protein